MIRINLIGGQKARSKPVASRGGKTQLLVYGGLILLEAVVLLVWQQKLSNELAEATKRTKDATAKIEDLKKVKMAWEAWQTEKADLDRQTAVFETLRNDQIGPPTMLQYLSYALTRIPDAPATGDEAKAQELVGWDPKWDPRRVWLKSIKEKDGNLVFSGEAIDHEDVAEFYRRLESSDFFPRVDPGLQSRKVHVDLGIKYVEFTVTSGLSYRAARMEPPKAPEQAPAAAPAAAQPPATPAAAAAAAGPGAPAGPGR